MDTGAPKVSGPFAPFKPPRKNTEWVERKQQEEWEEFGSELTSDTYPYGYGHARDANGDITLRFKEKFRSPVEVEWARAFDELGFQWEYEPLKFDMGLEYVSYCPDFRVEGLSVPGSDRPLYIEVKWFGEDMNLTKYVHFTRLYHCDLLVLAHYDRAAWKRAASKQRNPPSVLTRKTHRYFLVLRCVNCDRYTSFPCSDTPTADYEPPHLEQRWQYESCTCSQRSVERLVVPDDYLIQEGAVKTGQIGLPDKGSGMLRIS